MRVSSPRFFIISTLVLILGLSLYFAGPELFSVINKGKVKSVDQYWAEAGVSSASLEELIQDSPCSSSERYYLSCANAVLAVASRYNLTLNSKGEFESVNPISLSEYSTEKQQLSVWKGYFENSPGLRNFSFLKAWQKLNKEIVVEKQKSFMVGIALNGFISVFKDPHTYLIPVALFKEVISKPDHQINSLGVILGKTAGQYVVRKIIPESAAERAGLQRGDVVLKIDDQDLKALMQGRVFELLKGELGSEVKIQIARDGHGFQFNLKREELKIETVNYRVIEGIKSIAIIGINKFAKGVCEKTKEVLSTAQRAQVRGLILDLRDNPGGHMEEAACVASLFLGPKKKVFQIRFLDSPAKTEDFYGTEQKQFDLPVAVLVNAGSASASEIVAGALQDYGRAVLVGEQTFGKGSFQEGEIWSRNHLIAMFETKGFYFLPSGRTPQLSGLMPDVKLNVEKLIVNREEDQFIHPLQNAIPYAKIHQRKISTKDCFESDATSIEDDQLVTKAKQILFCSKFMAGVSL